MPANKNQRIRCKILDDCFRNRGKNYQIEDLVNAVNEGMAEVLPDGGTVSRRTIYNDIAFMQTPEGGMAEIEKWKEGVKTYYRYADPNFSILNNPINETDRQYLRTLVATLSNMKGLPQVEALRESLSNIEILSVGSQATPCIEFEENPYIVGLQHLQPLNNAIQSHSAQELVYEPYGKPAKTYRFHPQYLKQYNHRWYVFGVTTDYPKSVSTFPLDRIVKLEPITDNYIVSDIDWSEYFDDVVGVSILPQGKVEEVHFLVHGKTGRYIESNPIHCTQRHKWIDEETLDVRLSVKVNYEFSRILMSYADSITLIGPQYLVEELKAKLQKAMLLQG